MSSGQQKTTPGCGRRQTLNNPKRRRTPEEIITQLLSGTPGLRARIDANCVSCVYDEIAPGNWRQQVEGCQLTECPMHPVRPRSTGRGG